METLWLNHMPLYMCHTTGGPEERGGDVAARGQRPGPDAQAAAGAAPRGAGQSGRQRAGGAADEKVSECYGTTMRALHCSACTVYTHRID